MTNEQKRFKILAKTSYEEQITDENKTTIKFTLLLGVNALTAAMLLSMPDAASSMSYAYYAAGAFTAVSTSANFVGLVQSISKKTMLQGKIDDINIELKASENEESRGMTR